MSIFARINRLQYVTRVSMGASCQDIFISKIQTPDRDNRNTDFYFQTLRTSFFDVCTRRVKKTSRRKGRKYEAKSFKKGVFPKRGEKKKKKKKNWRVLTLSPRCIPTFAAGPSGRVHITYANVRPSVPVLPPTTLRPKPAAVKSNEFSI